MQSPRLKYRKIGPEDSDFIGAYLSDPELTRFLPLGGPYPRNQVEEFLVNRIRHWRRHGFGTFVMSLPATGRVIGYCGLEHVKETEFVDIRYGVVRDLWGEGMATEAAQRCLAFGFADLNLMTLFGAAHPDNLPSITVLKRIGMKPCKGFDFYGDRVDYFQMTRSDYLK